jgi:hypothetical protein
MTCSAAALGNCGIGAISRPIVVVLLYALAGWRFFAKNRHMAWSILGVLLITAVLVILVAAVGKITLGD